MNWTEQQFAELQARRGVRGARPVVDVSDPPFAIGREPVVKMNKTEAAYDRHLQALHDAGEVLWHKFEPIKLKLADGSWFKPDFGVQLRDRTFEFHETKGFWREAARVRIKVAAGLFPFFRFIAIKRANGGWKREEFS